MNTKAGFPSQIIIYPIFYSNETILDNFFFKNNDNPRSENSAQIKYKLSIVRIEIFICTIAKGLDSKVF